MALLILLKYRKCETVRCEKCYQIQIKREYGSEENAKRRGSVHMKKASDQSVTECGSTYDIRSGVDIR